MTPTATSLIVRCAEYLPKEEADCLLAGRRGIYALFRHRGDKVYDVVYVGLSRTGIRARLRAHRRKKGKLWSHFSVFEVRPTASDQEIRELEGLFRHIYRRDRRANRLNKQKTHGPLKALRNQDLRSWGAGHEESPLQAGSGGGPPAITAGEVAVGPSEKA